MPDAGTITLQQYIAPRTEAPLGVLQIRMQAGAAGAFEKSLSAVTRDKGLWFGRITALAHKPTVNPTALSDLDIFDDEHDTLLAGAVVRSTNASEGQDLITTSYVYRIIPEAQRPPVICNSLRFKVVNNAVATYDGILYVFLMGAMA